MKTPGRILVVDDEKLTRETLGLRLEDEGFDVFTAENAYRALEILASEEVDVILTDLRMPSMDGLEFQHRLGERGGEEAVVFMTAFGTVSTAVAAMRQGAADFLTKPVNSEELVLRVRRLVEQERQRDEIRRLRLDVARCRGSGEMIYGSDAMTAVVERAAMVADSDVSVLIQGETGTGKEVMARFIHESSPRASGPFVAVNCSGLNPNLIESELFGHEAGSFTGATRQRKGRMELADHGTLLIDEVDDLGPEVQVRLLRFLEDRGFERVGSSRTIRANVRVLCATKVSLPECIETGRFREDLYYRINTVTVELPPLRERKEDIVALAEHFASRFGESKGFEGAGVISPEALAVLQVYEWPGNVRELMHAIEHAVVFARGGTIRPEHLPSHLPAGETVPAVELHLAGRESVSFTRLMAGCERQLIEWALSKAGGSQVLAAALLDLPRTTLRSRLAALHRDSSARRKGNGSRSSRSSRPPAR